VDSTFSIVVTKRGRLSFVENIKSMDGHLKSQATVRIAHKSHSFSVLYADVFHLTNELWLITIYQLQGKREKLLCISARVVLELCILNMTSRATVNVIAGTEDVERNLAAHTISVRKENEAPNSKPNRIYISSVVIGRSRVAQSV
jgi:hypothetical protein